MFKCVGHLGHEPHRQKSISPSMEGSKRRNVDHLEQSNLYRLSKETLVCTSRCPVEKNLWRAVVGSNKDLNKIIKERGAIEALYWHYLSMAKTLRDDQLAQLATKCPRHRYINEVSEERVRRVCKFCGKVLRWY